MFRVILSVVLSCLSLFLLSCSDKQRSPEDEIRQYIATGIEAAENRSAGDVTDLVHQNYRGQRNLDRNQLEKLLRVYFFRHKNIFLFTKNLEIDLHSDSDASVSLHVAMAGSAISSVSMLSSLRARIYKFELELVKQDKWLLQSAKWYPAGLSDMQ
ncbi:MAG: hypothetical protein GY744_20265 [Gammaproteobacteria bacterium]|nr:hypothetical protein [Gammaproteobacteria bacterium]